MFANARGTVSNIIRRFRSANSEEGRRPTQRELELEQQLRDSQLREQQLKDKLTQRKETGFAII